MGTTFTQSFTSIAYNVTAVEQSDPSSDVGPAYLLNGLSDAGYWYQVGLSWNWDPGHTPGTGFDFVYEVFDPSGESIFPYTGGGGLLSFSGQVQVGDEVLLNLYFSPTYGVVMFAEDNRTGATASETYSAVGGTHFVGLPSGTSDSNGFFTGLMTEWYHSAAYYSNVKTVTYSDPTYAISSAWMWMDEFSCPDPSCTGSTSLFSSQTPSPVQYNGKADLQPFASSGATEYGSAYEFITGPAYYSLNVSYSVASSAAGYSPPSFTYTYNNVVHTVPLAQTPSTYIVDVGSAWHVDSVLPGSTSAERWALALQDSSGTARASQTLNFTYEHQFMLTVVGGSGGLGEGGWATALSRANASSLTVYDRSGGSGFRVCTCTVDGSPCFGVPLANLTGSSVLVRVLMDAPHTVVFGSVRQFELFLNPSAKASLLSITQPTLSGDDYWYDNGTLAAPVFHYSWGTVGNESRLVALSYSVDGTLHALKEQGSGSFGSTVLMDGPHSIAMNSTAQFYLAVGGAAGAAPSVRSPTKDGWYNSGTRLRIAVLRDVGGIAGRSRFDLASYAEDGQATPVDRGQTGNFTTPTIDMNSTHYVSFVYEEQYYVSFSFTDESRRSTLSPTAVQVNSSGYFENSNGWSFWADSGTTLRVTAVTWEGVNVSPGERDYPVNGQAPTPIALRVFEAELRVVDVFGMPVEGTQVGIHFVNGTSTTARSGPGGLVNVGFVPLGRFNATASYFGLSAGLIADASVHQSFQVTVPLSPLVLVVVAAALVVAGCTTALLQRRHRQGASPRTGPSRPAEATHPWMGKAFRGDSEPPKSDSTWSFGPQECLVVGCPVLQSDMSLCGLLALVDPSVSQTLERELGKLLWPSIFSFSPCPGPPGETSQVPADGPDGRHHSPQEYASHPKLVYSSLSAGRDSWPVARLPS